MKNCAGCIIMFVITVACCVARAANITSYEGFDYQQNLYRNRRTSSPQLSVPDFFILGAQKCGTSSLYHIITNMNAVCSQATTKEPKFFISESYYLGDDYYAGEVFGQCAEEELRVDGSVGYFHCSNVQSRFLESYSLEDLAKKKFILLLRDEVSRDISWYKHQVRECSNQMKIAVEHRNEQQNSVQGDANSVLKVAPIDVCDNHSCQNSAIGCSEMEIDTTDSKEFVDYRKHLNSFEEYYRTGGVNLKHSPSNYFRHINDWLKIIKRDQLFIIHMDALTHNTTDTMKRIAAFLGIEYDLGDDVELPHWNESEVDVFVTCETFDKMLDHYKRANAGLKEFINKHHAPFEPEFPGFQYTRRICTDQVEDPEIDRTAVS